MTDMTVPSLAQSLPIPDTQSERDERHLAIQRVGIRALRYPIAVPLSPCGVPEGRS